jgi:hypothetical protein
MLQINIFFLVSFRNLHPGAANVRVNVTEWTYTETQHTSFFGLLEVFFRVKIRYTRLDEKGKFEALNL